MAAPSWSSLANCPLPVYESGTVCELHTVIKSSADGANEAAKVIERLPDISAASTAATDPGRPAVSSSASASTAKTAFLAPAELDGRDQAVWRRFFFIFQEEGFLGAIQDLVSNQEKRDQKNTFFKMAANLFLSVHQYATTNAIYGAFLLPKNLSAEELSEKFSPTRDWTRSSIRCLAWHPNTCKIACASRDDSVQIHSSPLDLGVVPLLKYKQQRGITCMAWRPFYSSELAVGCSSGLLIWTVDPVSVVARPSAGCVSLLQSPGHSPVTALEWQPNGDLLMSCSANDSSVILWNTASETRTCLRRFGTGYHLLSWSPNLKNVFAGSTNNTFRIWNTCRFWTQQKWNVFNGHVRAACWSADGSVLLYATSEDPRIFAIRFDSEDFESLGSAVPVMDLNKVSVDDVATVGGIVKNMKWDKNGDRLVVSFTDSPLMVAFQTQISPSNISLFPIGFINGESPQEFPSCFEFAPHFDQGALLTIAWSSGRVQHFPMFFTPSNQSKRLLQDISFTTNDFQQTGGMTRQLSTSHLLNNSLHAQADFEPQLFSGPTS